MRNRLLSLLAWFMWGISLWFLLRPAIVAQPSGDDLINPFYQFYETRGGLIETFKLGIEYGTSHKFDVVGQTFFVLHSWLWLQINYLFGWSHLTFYSVSKWLIFMFSIASAGVFFRTALKFSNIELPKSIAVWLVTLPFAATVQIHAIWSNDPVANYPMSGFAAAGFGFLALNFISQSVSNRVFRQRFLASIFLATAILYYQINIVLILATVPVLWLVVLKHDSPNEPRTISNFVKITSSYYAIPVLIVVWGYWITSGKTDNYGGTTLGSIGKFPSTTAISLVSSLPGGGWNLSLETVSQSPIDLGSLLAFALTFVVGGTFVAVWLYRSWTVTHRINSTSALLILCSILYWIGSTCIQTITDKYQNEIVRVGQVYNFYAQGALSISILLALVVVVVKKRPSVLWLVSSLVLTFGMIQASINLALVEGLRAGNGASLSVLKSYAEDSSDEERCLAWDAWSSGAWPEYYEQGLSVGLSLAFEHFYDTEFCSRGVPVRP